MKKPAWILLLVPLALAQPGYCQGWNVSPLGSLYQNASLHGVAVQGNFAYLADAEDGLLIVDISNPAQMEQVGSLSSIGDASSVILYGNYAYLQCGGDTTRIVDVSDPEHPRQVGSVPLDGNFCALEAGWGYAATSSDGVMIFDVSVPASPVLVSQYNPPILAFLSDLDKEGDYLFVVCCWGSEEDYGGDALLVLDVSNPTSPVSLGLTAMFGRLCEIEVNQGFAYFTGSEITFQSWDVTNPAAPIQAGGLHLSSATYSLATAGNFAFTTSSIDLVRVIDLSDPFHPIVSGYYDTPEWAGDVAAADDYAYVADGDHFEVYDCSIAAHNDLAVSAVPFIQPLEVPASGGAFDYYLFAENGGTDRQPTDSWIQVVMPNGTVVSPVQGPYSLALNPGTTGWLRHQSVPATAPPGQYAYITCLGNYPTLFWASDTLSFTKLEAGGDGIIPTLEGWACYSEPFPGQPQGSQTLSIPSDLTLSTSPNPFNPQTVARYEIRDARHVSLRVYDTAGREVVTLVDGWREAGSQEVTFDGSGLPSGIYFARLEAGGQVQVQKLMLVK
ncbi:MAG: T9SS C-terminal target domain-containing protein [Candidatus Zixiibacteriota bacterium]|nr:MAG: T9SS C-terminal target domain-containing protein [candidate division Zixibacteria bacterium]